MSCLRVICVFEACLALLDGRAGLNASRTCVSLFCLQYFLLSLPLVAMGWQRLVLVALPELFISLLNSFMDTFIKAPVVSVKMLLPV